MNTDKINQLKAAAEAAHAALQAETKRLVAAGFKSQERYQMLKAQKDAAAALHAEYVRYTHGQINRELVKIIKAGSAA